MASLINKKAVLVLLVVLTLSVLGEIRRGWKGVVNPYFKWVLSLPLGIWNWRWVFQADSFLK